MNRPYRGSCRNFYAARVWKCSTAKRTFWMWPFEHGSFRHGVYGVNAAAEQFLWCAEPAQHSGTAMLIGIPKCNFESIIPRFAQGHAIAGAFWWWRITVFHIKAVEAAAWKAEAFHQCKTSVPTVLMNTTSMRLLFRASKLNIDLNREIHTPIMTQR